MRLHAIAATVALALGASSSMAAVCTSTTSLGNMGPPGFELFGNSFSSAGSFSDCYTFSLSADANSFGGTIEIDPLFNKLDIDVTKVSLYFGDSLVGSDNSPSLFSFSSLAGGIGGTYTLMVSGDVTRDPGLWNAAVAYAGAIQTIASPVPEPGAVALLLAGFAGVGAATWRRSKL